MQALINYSLLGTLVAREAVAEEAEKGEQKEELPGLAAAIHVTWKKLIQQMRCSTTTITLNEANNKNNGNSSSTNNNNNGNNTVKRPHYELANCWRFPLPVRQVSPSQRWQQQQ